MTDQTVSIRPSGDEVDWGLTLQRLDRMLRIRTTPIGMKMRCNPPKRCIVAKRPW